MVGHSRSLHGLVKAGRADIFDKGFLINNRQTE